MKTCKTCLVTKDESEFYPIAKIYLSSNCKDCSKVISKQWQRENKEKASDIMRRHRNANPDRYKARNRVFVEIRAGRLIKKPCEVCGILKVEAHHDDYSKPLDVRWLCKKHHVKIEQQKD